MCQDDSWTRSLDLSSPSTEEAEREINVNYICGSLTENFVINKINEMTANEFVHYQSTIINHVHSVTSHKQQFFSELHSAGRLHNTNNSYPWALTIFYDRAKMTWNKKTMTSPGRPSKYEKSEIRRKNVKVLTPDMHALSMSSISYASLL